MRSGFLHFLKKNRNKRVKCIFDLDKTLWDYTVESSPGISVNEIKNYIHKSRVPILEELQREGHSINIASRSTETTKCAELLHHAFPTIQFSAMQIYHTPFSKREHIRNIIDNEEEKFHLFDDELHILNDISSTFKNAHVYHTPKGLHMGIFEKTARQPPYFRVSAPVTAPSSMHQNVTAFPSGFDRGV